MEEDLESDDAQSVDSVDIARVLDWKIDEDDDRLILLCEDTNGNEEWHDRSDLMDEGRQQRLVLGYERKHAIPWDPFCPCCGGEGCEECECSDCERPCRFLRGVNYGCVCHPVV